MDIELARTFLEIVSTKSFAKAAERLNVAQTTVSARIRLLEDQIGRPLFIRNKGGATLTPAGNQFLRYAPGFVQLWQRARHQIGLPVGYNSSLTLGSEISLWEPLLLSWLTWMRSSLSDVALRVHVDVPEDLITRVAEGLVDAAIMYAPPQVPGVEIDFLTEERLILVKGAKKAVTRPEYIYVEWGHQFQLHHDDLSPGAAAPLVVNLGPLARSYILKNGGSAYLRSSVIAPYLASGELVKVEGASEMSYPVYVVYSAHSDPHTLQRALSGLRKLVAVIPSADEG